MLYIIVSTLTDQAINSTAYDFKSYYLCRPYILQIIYRQDLIGFQFPGFCSVISIQLLKVACPEIFGKGIVIKLADVITFSNNLYLACKQLEKLMFMLPYQTVL